MLEGDHTRNVFKATPSANIGLMRFAVRKSKCFGCKTPIEGNATLCKHCEPKRVDIYMGVLNKANLLEGRFTKLWTQCQRCQGSLHQDVLCTSRDCPIFYMRKKVQKDLEKAQLDLEKFDF